MSEFITREGGTTNTSGLVGAIHAAAGHAALTVTKSGPATMNPGVSGDFGLNVQNTGFTARSTRRSSIGCRTARRAGCASTDAAVLSARVFAADGVTPVPGKGPLVQGTDYSLVYNGAACELTFKR